MSMKLNATIADHVYKDIVEDARPKGMNRSEWVEELILKGFERKKGDLNGENQELSG